MPSAKKSSINIEYLNFRNLDPFLPRIGDEAKWAPWKVGCRSGWRPPGRTKASPSPPPFRPYLDRRRSRFPLFLSQSGRCTITSDDVVVSGALGGGDGHSSSAECAWTLLLCCMEAMANAHNGGGPTALGPLPLNPRLSRVE